jgi:hypothetical protein
MMMRQMSSVLSEDSRQARARRREAALARVHDQQAMVVVVEQPSPPEPARCVDGLSIAAAVTAPRQYEAPASWQPIDASRHIRLMRDFLAEKRRSQDYL